MHFFVERGVEVIIFQLRICLEDQKTQLHRSTVSTSLLSHPLRDSLVSDSAEMGRLSPMLKLRSDPSGKRSDLLRRERGRSEVRLEVGATEYEATMDSHVAAP